MRCLKKTGDTLHVETDLPNLQTGDVRIEVSKALITHTDLAIADGLFDFDGILGHQFVGTVIETNDDDTRQLKGQRIVASPIIGCRECDMCKAGLAAHCRKRTIAGISDRDGCLAESIALPAANCVEVPAAIDDDRAAFVWLVASARQAVRQCTVEGRPYITVLGDGPLGLLTAQLMTKLNASVRVVGNFSEKLAMCEKWGIQHRHADDIGRRADQDIVVDCTGKPTGFELAIRLVRPRGMILLKSLVSYDRFKRAAQRGAIDLSPIVMNEIQLQGSFAGPIPEALNLIASEEVDVISLMSSRGKLRKGEELLLAARRPESLAVVVDV